MNCKNCKTQLENEHSFCPNCGSKIIKNRLNFSSLADDFLSTYFCWDNKFLKTFLDLFTKPESVINGYIDGIRKRYMQPFSYLIISLALYGVYLFFAKDSIAGFYENASLISEKSLEANTQSFNYFTNNFNLISFVTIPVTALLSLLIFRKYKYNFIEHNLIYIYINAQYNIIGAIVGLVSLLLSNNLSFIISQTIIMIVLFVYYPYVFKRVFKLSVKQIIVKSIAFLGMIFVIAVVIGFFMGLLIKMMG